MLGLHRRSSLGLLLLFAGMLLLGMLPASADATTASKDCYDKCRKESPKFKPHVPFCDKDDNTYDDYCHAKCSCKKHCDKEPKECNHHNKRSPPPKRRPSPRRNNPPRPPPKTDFVPAAIETGGFHTCVVSTIGNMKCFGGNSQGQLGLGDTNNRGNAPREMGGFLPLVDVGPGLRVSAVATGYLHTCAVLQPGGIVKCWGVNTYGQLGYGDTTTRGDQAGEMGAALPAVDLGSGLSATAVTAGAAHTCALLQPGGIIKCWGENGAGQLGLGDTATRGDQPGEMGDALPAVDLGPGLTATALAAGVAFTCALLQPGPIVKCWGDGIAGQLGLGVPDYRGDGPGEMGAALPPVDLGTGFTNITSLATGWYHVCVVLQPGGKIKCWGDNSYGELGLGDTVRRGVAPGQMGDALPTVDVGPGLTATAVSAGEYTTCALLQPGGVVKCWGLGGIDFSEDSVARSRGDEPGEMGAALPPLQLGAGLIAVQVSAGDLFSCALLQPGNVVKCWGDNAIGQLGLGSRIRNIGSPIDPKTSSLPPVQLS